MRTSIFKQAIEASGNPIAVVRCASDDQPIVYANRAFQRLTGSADEPIVGRDWRALYERTLERSEAERLFSAILAGQRAHLVIRHLTHEGTESWSELHLAPLESGAQNVRYCMVAVHDVTAQRRWREELEYRAYHDALTGLPNRYLLQDRLEQTIARARRGDAGFALAFVDLDGFKAINDRYGHAMGDEVLKLVAARLSGALRAGDTAARLGGDEFVLLFDDAGADAVHAAVARIEEALRPSATIDGHRLSLSCSIGIGLFPQDGTDAQSLLSRADGAMYRVKWRRQRPACVPAVSASAAL